MPRNNRTRTSLATNRRMNDETYALRRTVMNVIYRAKEMADLPRIDVRIADMAEDNVLGLGRMGQNVIWISAKWLQLEPRLMYRVVLHEILHAVIAQEHVQDCPLMGTSVNTNASDTEIDELFRQYMTA